MKTNANRFYKPERNAVYEGDDMFIADACTSALAYFETGTLSKLAAIKLPGKRALIFIRPITKKYEKDRRNHGRCGKNRF